MANIETTGPVHAITDEVTRGKYTSRVLVISTTDNPKYPQLVPFEFSGDKGLGQLEGVRVGDTVTVTWEPRGREWTDPKTGVVKFFGSFAGWKVDRSKTAARGPQPPSGGGSAGVDDDIPFATADMGREPSPISRALRGAV